MRFDALSRNDWIVGGLALLLAIDLLFLPWFSWSYLNYSVTATATSAPDGWTAILAMLAALAIVADVLVERLSPQTALPNFRGSRTSTRLLLAVIAAALLALKFILNVHFNLFDFGFYAAVVLCAALVFSTLRLSQDREILARSSTP